MPAGRHTLPGPHRKPEVSAGRPMPGSRARKCPPRPHAGAREWKRRHRGAVIAWLGKGVADGAQGGATSRSSLRSPCGRSRCCAMGRRPSTGRTPDPANPRHHARRLLTRLSTARPEDWLGRLPRSRDQDAPLWTFHADCSVVGRHQRLLGAGAAVRRAVRVVVSGGRVRVHHGPTVVAERVEHTERHGRSPTELSFASRRRPGA